VVLLLKNLYLKERTFVNVVVNWIEIITQH